MPGYKKKCKVCGVLVSNVTRHMEMHSNLGPLKCGVCDSEIAHKSGLYIHGQRAHELPGVALKAMVDKAVAEAENRHSLETAEGKTDDSDFASAPAGDAPQEARWGQPGKCPASRIAGARVHTGTAS